MSKLKAVRLEITNVLGINQVTIDLSGKITEISGKNGEGKTSCMQALQSVLTSTESATLIRNGASHGKAVLILSDGSQIVSAFKPGKSSKRAMFDAEGRTIPRAATEIDGLFDAHSLNPVDFLTAKGKARIEKVQPLFMEEKACHSHHNHEVLPDRTEAQCRAAEKATRESSASSFWACSPPRHTLAGA